MCHVYKSGHISWSIQIQSIGRGIQRISANLNPARKKWLSVRVLSMYKFRQFFIKKGESIHVSKSNISLPEWLAVTRTSAPRCRSIWLLLCETNRQFYMKMFKCFNASTLQNWLEDTVCKLNEISPYRSLFSDTYVNPTSVQLRLTF